MKHHPTLFAAAWLLFSGCQCNDDPAAASLSHNVGESFAACKEPEIKFLAAKHNVQLAFRPCGNNAFATYRWSPDGFRVYFQLVLSAYVMNADAPDRNTIPVQTTSPVGPGEWMGAQTLALPVLGKEEGDPLRIAVYDLPASNPEPGVVQSSQVIYHPLPELGHIGQLRLGDQPTDLLFAASATAEAPLTLYRMDTSSGDFAPAFPWLTAPFTSFDYTPAQHMLLLGHQDEVWMIDARTGEERGRWTNAKRGALHPEGRWLALEYDGPPISIYSQRTWDELSDKAREREEARTERFAEGLPDWSPREVRPPSLSMVDLSTGERWAFTAFQGDQFQWYEARSSFASFFLWGFEGKQLKRNVALANFADRLRSIEQGSPMMGVLPFDRYLEVGGVPRELPTE